MWVPPDYSISLGDSEVLLIGVHTQLLVQGDIFDSIVWGVACL